MSGTTRTRTTAPRASGAAGPAFPVIEAKLSIPPTREGIVPRDRLLRRLRASGDRPLVAVVAPPGYGKTTLLAQWAETDGRPVLWLTVDQRDNDPSVLLTYLAVGLDRIRPIDRVVFRSLASPGAQPFSAVLRLVAAVQATDPKPLIVLDDTHLLTEEPSLDVVTELATALPAGAHLAIAGRTDSVLPLPVLRASGRLLEIGPDELAMDDDETASLLHAAGPEILPDAIGDVVQRTEGWPVAAYLAALSFGSRAGRDGLQVFNGADRFVSDYVWSEILDRVPPKDLRFLIRTSVLDRMCGPLCDAVTGTRGSAHTLRRLEAASLLLVPLDRRREWYRYHQLLRDVLRGELEHREPGRAVELQRRAAEWYQREGSLDAALEYHIAADDAERVATLTTVLAQPMYRAGRVSTLQRWLAWLEEREAVADNAPLAVLAGWLHAMTGDPAGAQRWAAAAERSSFVGSLPDGSPSIEPWMAGLRALRCPEGAAMMRRDAERALEGTPPTSFFHASSLVLMGVAKTLNGEPGGETLYADAADAGATTEAYPLACLSFGLLAASMASRGDWTAVETAIERASHTIDQAGLHEYWTSALVYVVRARLALHRTDREGAQADLIRAQRLRPVLTHAIPWYAVQARLEMIRAHITLADPAGARTLLRETDDILRRSPDLGTLHEEAEEVRRLVQAMPTGATGASSLTAAELRLLPYLHTYMSFRDIGHRLFVSPNTVKTQAVSLYRKLGVSSRSEAMERAEELGLIDR